MFEVIKTYDNWARALLKQKKDAFVQQTSKWSLGPQADWLAGDDSNSQSCLQDGVKLITWLRYPNNSESFTVVILLRYECFNRD